MTLTDGILVPTLDANGKIQLSPDPQTASKSVKYYSGNKNVDGADLFQAANNTTTKFYFTIPVTLEFVGVLVYFGIQAVVGDKIKLEVLSGTTVVGDFGPDFGVIPNKEILLQEQNTKKDLPAGLKLCVTYISIGTINNVDFVINYKVKV